MPSSKRPWILNFIQPIIDIFIKKQKHGCHLTDDGFTSSDPADGNDDWVHVPSADSSSSTSSSQKEDQQNMLAGENLVESRRRAISRRLLKLMAKRSELSDDIRYKKVQSAYKHSQLEASIRLLVESSHRSSEIPSKEPPEMIARAVQERFEALTTTGSSIAKLERELNRMDSSINEQLKALTSTYPDADQVSESDGEMVQADESTLGTPSTVRHLFREKGQLGILNGRLEDYHESYLEEVTDRDFQRDHDITPMPSDEAFEQEFRDKVAALTSQIREAEAKVAELEKLCRERGYATISRRRSLAAETASEQDDQEMMTKEDLDVAAEPTKGGTGEMVEDWLANME